MKTARSDIDRAVSFLDAEFFAIFATYLIKNKMKKTFWVSICLLMCVLSVSAENSGICADKSAASVLLSRDSRKDGEDKKVLLNAAHNAVDSFCHTLEGGVKAGYAGFVDASVLATMTGESAVSVSTTHGYCFNPFVFVGAGLACDVYRDVLFTPVYAAARFTLRDSWLAPYIGVRVGFSPGKKDGSHWAMGAYCSPSLGLRLALNGHRAVNVGIAYVLQSQSTDYSYDDGYKRYFGTTVDVHHSIALRVGFEF